MLSGEATRLQSRCQGHDPVVRLMAEGPDSEQLRRLYDALLDEHYAIAFPGSEPSFLPGASVESSARIVVQGNTAAVTRGLDRIVAVATRAAEVCGDEMIVAAHAVAQLQVAQHHAKAALAGSTVGNVAAVARLLALYDAMVVMSVVRGLQSRQRGVLLAKSCFQDQTLLHLVARSGSEPAVQMLLQTGTRLGISDEMQSSVDKLQRTARMLARTAGFKRLIKQLGPSGTDAGCDANNGKCNAPLGVQYRQWGSEVTNLKQMRGWLSASASGGKPCVVRRGISLEEQNRFIRQVDHLANTRVSVHSVPYADRFIANHKPRSLSIAQYHSLNISAEEPLYAFEKFGSGHPLYAASRQLMSSWYPGSTAARNFQFSYGPEVVERHLTCTAML